MIKVKILDNRIKEENLTPATSGSAAIDLRACISASTKVLPGNVLKVGTGLAIHIGDSKMAGIILPRSGLGTKGLVIGNLVGLIDSDYQGELSVTLWNRTDKPIEVSPLDRIAQLAIIPVVVPEYKVVEEFEEQTGRGTGGYGSTGVQ